MVAIEGQEVVVQRLLENGVEVESKDKYKQTPLWITTKNRQEVVVKLLL